ncbi:hypothetical protein YPPY55_2229, partial [Yersinia pestis PY-55]
MLTVSPSQAVSSR